MRVDEVEHLTERILSSRTATEHIIAHYNEGTPTAREGDVEARLFQKEP
jgi:hypothetical protein